MEGSWEWCSNAKYCERGCRILTKWNKEMLTVMVVTQSDQAMLYLVETVDGQKSFFCSIVYAETKGKDRRKLWDELRVISSL